MNAYEYVPATVLVGILASMVVYLQWGYLWTLHHRLPKIAEKVNSGATLMIFVGHAGDACVGVFVNKLLSNIKAGADVTLILRSIDSHHLEGDQWAFQVAAVGGEILHCRKGMKMLQSWAILLDDKSLTRVDLHTIKHRGTRPNGYIASSQSSPHDVIDRRALNDVVTALLNSTHSTSVYTEKEFLGAHVLWPC